MCIGNVCKLGRATRSLICVWNGCVHICMHVEACHLVGGEEEHTCVMYSGSGPSLLFCLSCAVIAQSDSKLLSGFCEMRPIHEQFYHVVCSIYVAHEPTDSEIWIGIGRIIATVRSQSSIDPELTTLIRKIGAVGMRGGNARRGATEHSLSCSLRSAAAPGAGFRRRRRAATKQCSLVQYAETCVAPYSTDHQFSARALILGKNWVEKKSALRSMGYGIW